MHMDRYLQDLRARQARTRPAALPTSVTYPLGEVPLPEYVSGWATHRPDRVALVCDGEELTYAGLDAAVGSLAGWLDTSGVRPGERVAIHLPNSIEYVVALLAVLRAGAVAVPVNPMFERTELEYELTDSGACTLITLETFGEKVRSVRAELPALRHVLAVRAPGSRPETQPAEGTESWDAALAHPAVPHRPVALDALAVLNYTGGTTGLPKGCEHTHRHMLYTFAATAATSGYTPERPAVALCFIPVFWIAGENLALSPFVTGGTTVLMRRWDAETMLRAVDAHRPTTMVGTVETYLELLARPDLDNHDLSCLTDPMAVSFVRTLTPEVRARWTAAAGPKSCLREGGYGMTETHTSDVIPFGLADDDRDLRAQPVFTGLPVPGTDVAVVSFETGQPLPLGVAGEIIVRGPSVMTGYWNNPAATADQLRDGWLHTGDNGVLDEDGCLHFLGRNKDMIKVKGMSVFPADVEMLLGRHPDVEACAVLPADDPELGQRPIAFVRTRPGSDTGAEALRAWAKENMARYKVPLTEVVEEFPMTTTGKIRKVALADRAQQLADTARTGPAAG